MTGAAAGTAGGPGERRRRAASHHSAPAAPATAPSAHTGTGPETALCPPYPRATYSPVQLTSATTAAVAYRATG